MKYSITLFFTLICASQLISEPIKRDDLISLCQNFGSLPSEFFNKLIQKEENYVLIKSRANEKIRIPVKYLTEANNISTKEDYIEYKDFQTKVCDKKEISINKIQTKFEQRMLTLLDKWSRDYSNFINNLENPVLTIFNFEEASYKSDNPWILNYFGRDSNADLYNTVISDKKYKTEIEFQSSGVLKISGVIKLNLEDEDLGPFPFTSFLGLPLGKKALNGNFFENNIFSLKHPLFFKPGFVESNTLKGNAYYFIIGYFKFSLLDDNVKISNCHWQNSNFIFRVADHSKKEEREICDKPKEFKIRTIYLENISTFIMDYDGNIFYSFYDKYI